MKIFFWSDLYFSGSSQIWSTAWLVGPKTFTHWQENDKFIRRTKAIKEFYSILVVKFLHSLPGSEGVHINCFRFWKRLLSRFLWLHPHLWEDWKANIESSIFPVNYYTFLRLKTSSINVWPWTLYFNSIELIHHDNGSDVSFYLPFPFGLENSILLKISRINSSKILWKIFLFNWYLEYSNIEFKYIYWSTKKWMCVEEHTYSNILWEGNSNF